MLGWMDPLGLAPTDKWAREFILELLGDHAKDGGAYIFKTVTKSGEIKFYVGKANNLYRRLTDHLRHGKLTNNMLDSITTVIDPKGSTPAEHFKLEASLIDEFGGTQNLANEINSPGVKC